MMAGEEALKNPTPDLILKEKADDLENCSDWAQAENVRREILAIEKQTGNFALIAKAQMDLSRLMRTLGRIDEASEFAREAVASAQRANMFPVLATALQVEAFCALERGDCANALALASRAVEAIGPEKLYASLKARALTTRARCRLANGNCAGAAQDLEAGREPKWEQSHFGGLPGPTLALANWWETKSELEQRQGNLPAAREAMIQSMAARRQFDSSHSRVTLARSCYRLAQLCRKDGDLEAENSVLAEAESIRKGLELPTGAGLSNLTTFANCGTRHAALSFRERR